KIPASRLEAHIRAAMAAVFGEPFDLSQAPLMRIVTLRISNDDHVLLLVMHHLIADAWSMHVFTNEIAMVYDAFSRNRPSPLSELPFQYPDFATRQRSASWTYGGVFSYWARRLKDGRFVLDLPADGRRPPVQTFRGAHRVSHIGCAVSEALMALSRNEGATLFMTTLSAFASLLLHFTGQTDLIVGCGTAGRDEAGTGQMIGGFLYTLVFGVGLSNDPLFF